MYVWVSCTCVFVEKSERLYVSFVCLSRVVLMVVAVAQYGFLPLHYAIRNNAGLDVVTALLQAHKHAAAVAGQVRVGAARGGVHSDLCIRMRQTRMHVHAVYICAMSLKSTRWHK